MHREGALPELLLPASGPEVLRVAVRYGADAVYLGGEAYSLRAKAINFTMEQMAEGIAYAHAGGVRVYVTVNILAHNEDLEQADAYLKELAQIRPDALLVADPGLFLRAKKLCPDIPLHISTQANNINYETFRFWHALGAERVVCGRELSLAEISQIRANIPDALEIEAFVHGAMCISYSGRCLLSAFLAERDANRGACTHPCRWNYTPEQVQEQTDDRFSIPTALGEEMRWQVREQSRPQEPLPVLETERGTFLFNSRDLCMVEHIPDMVSAGIDSLKIEGRMKNALYVASVARTYRRALNDLAQGREVYESHLDWYRQQIKACTFRPFTTGFFYQKPDQNAQIYTSNTYEHPYTYIGIVQEVRPSGEGTEVRIEQKNKFLSGQLLEVMKPDGRDLPARVLRICTPDGTQQEAAPHPKQQLWLTLSESEIEVGEVLRRKEEPGA